MMALTEIALFLPAVTNAEAYQTSLLALSLSTEPDFFFQDNVSSKESCAGGEG